MIPIDRNPIDIETIRVLRKECIEMKMERDKLREELENVRKEKGTD